MGKDLLTRDTPLPKLITEAGPKAKKRFIEFFTANIRNLNTRLAYLRAVRDFSRWADKRGFSLELIEPVTVAAYIEELSKTHSKPTVKQSLAAIRMLFDYLVVGQIIPGNPAGSVRGPKYVIKRGKTPVLSADEARTLLDSIGTDSLIALRDRALIAVMVFSFARISATVHMKVSDYYQIGKRSWLRLAEKGGKHHEVPCHHKAEEYLDQYIKTAGIADEERSPLFRGIIGRTKKLSAKGLSRTAAFKMIKKRALAAGLGAKINCHTFRATGITAYLSNGGTIENAQVIAGHESPRTTKLYDRTSDDISLDEVERIRI